MKQLKLLTLAGLAILSLAGCASMKQAESDQIRTAYTQPAGDTGNGMTELGWTLSRTSD
jgi:hypothetical protein